MRATATAALKRKEKNGNLTSLYLKRGIKKANNEIKKRAQKISFHLPHLLTYFIFKCNTAAAEYKKEESIVFGCG